MEMSYATDVVQDRLRKVSTFKLIRLVLSDCTRTAEQPERIALELVVVYVISVAKQDASQTNQNRFENRIRKLKISRPFVEMPW